MAGAMTIHEVNTSSLAKRFLLLPVSLYKDHPNWIRPLDKDVEEVFDTNRNPYFSHGECKRWVLINDNGQTIGRVAAFIDRNTAYKNDQPTGGIGFFECVDDKAAAFKLLHTCKVWLESQGMEAMDGPINFGERNRWWGLLIEGWQYEPNYCMPYTLAYYKDIFEAYGFKEYYKQFTYHRNIAGELDQALTKRAQRIKKNAAYRFSDIQNLTFDQVVHDFRIVYNQAWVGYTDTEEMTSEQVWSLLLEIKPIMDKRLIWFGYYKDEPIAFAVMLPEVNQLFKHMNGRFGVWQKLKFLWLKKRRPMHKILGVAFGVIPRFQRKGIESAIINAISDMAHDPQNKFNYKEVEHNWVGDFNPQMMKVHELMGGKVKKVHATYRFLFDENKEFSRAQVVN